jgi:hypothetical protein
VESRSRTTEIMQQTKRELENGELTNSEIEGAIRVSSTVLSERPRLHSFATTRDSNTIVLSHAYC